MARLEERLEQLRQHFVAEHAGHMPAPSAVMNTMRVALAATSGFTESMSDRRGDS